MKKHNPGKVCIKCSVWKLLDEFYKNYSRLDALSKTCKSCYYKHSKKYREENKEKLLVKSKKYREENKEKLLVKSKKYYEENKEKLLAKSKENRLVQKKARTKILLIKIGGRSDG